MSTLLQIVPLVLLFYTTTLSATELNDTHRSIVATRSFVSGAWDLLQQGTTGVSAMQLAIMSETKAIIYDKVEHNPLTTNGNLAWAAEYDIPTNTVRALNPLSNSWCAAGAHLSNGTFINTGGNPVVLTGDDNGLQAIRFFTPCDDDTCDVQEWIERVRLTSSRWYPSAARLDDGSVIIFGGSTGGGYIDDAAGNNPTYEFYPPKNINGFNGLQIPSQASHYPYSLFYLITKGIQFLQDTLNANHFPIMFLLPDGTLFVAANQDAMIFNWRTNTETRLPGIPNGVRVTSPFSATAVLLPLSPANDYTPEVLICGGSTISDAADPSTVSSQTPASAQCSRMVLNEAGITAGWAVESMPQARVMPDGILLPDGRILIVNGAQTGVAGYGNVMDPIGQSNADNPAFTPVLYDPTAPAGSRFSSDDLPTSSIPRLYHSTATLTANGDIMIAGCNPNEDVSTVKYATEYRVEWLSPPYLSQPRPTYTGLPTKVNFGKQFTLSVTLPSSATSVTVALMDLGFATHGVHMDQRLVQLASTLSANRKKLTVTAPPNGMVYPPGPAYLFVVTDAGVPSFGNKLIIGTGASPPVNKAAIRNMLANTPGPDDVAAALVPVQSRPKTGEGSHTPTAPIPAPPRASATQH